MSLRSHRDGDTLTLELVGDWCAARVGELERELPSVDLAGAARVVVDASRVRALDTSGAWLLRDLQKRLQGQGVQLEFRGGAPDLLRLVDATLAGGAAGAARARAELGAAAAHVPWDEMQPVEAVEAVGRRAVRLWRDFVGGFAFTGEVSVTLLRGLIAWRRLRPISIARHVYETGITAIPIVSLIAFLIAVIIAYMGARELRSYGADIFVVNLVVVGVLRVLGVLLTAIIVAGRSGSAFAAEIGAMRLNEEVDALHAVGVSPVEVLILPRIIGLVIAVPLLTVIADVVGIAGGAMLCHYLLDMPLVQYFSRVQEAIASTTFWVGLIQAPVFALLIAGAGTYRGMQVRGSSRELGRLVTVAVVQAIFMVILACALFAVLFQALDV